MIRMKDIRCKIVLPDCFVVAGLTSIVSRAMLESSDELDKLLPLANLLARGFNRGSVMPRAASRSVFPETL